MRTVLGVDLDADAPDLFDAAVPGTVLLLDADGACYRAAATAKTLGTAYRRFIQEVLTDQFLTKAASVQAHITLAGGRKADRALYPTVLPYQANRNGKSKPALLEPLRQFLAAGSEPLPDGIELTAHSYWEADDGLIMDATSTGAGCIMKSDDKDLRMARCPYWECGTGVLDVIDNRYGWIAPAYTAGHKLKVVGHGTKFFWAQMLVGDRADNVRGLGLIRGQRIAESGALEFLADINDENEAADRVLWEYARSGQDALAEAEVLWLRRSTEDSAYKYLMELALDGGLSAWMQELRAYHKRLFKLASSAEEFGYED